VVAGLTPSIAPAVGGVHFYTFGGLKKTVSWLEAARQRIAASRLSAS
jgi:hypothetical protein